MSLKSEDVVVVSVLGEEMAAVAVAEMMLLILFSGPSVMSVFVMESSMM